MPFAVDPGTYTVDSRRTATYRVGLLDNAESEQSVDLRTGEIELDVLLAPRLDVRECYVASDERLAELKSESSKSQFVPWLRRDGEKENVVIFSNSGFLINEDGVLSVNVDRSSSNAEKYSVYLELSPASQKVMTRDTSLMIERSRDDPIFRITISFDGKLLTVAEVDRVIDDQIEIAGEFSETAAEQLATSIGMILRNSGLDFLADYPRLRGLFLRMTQQELLRIAEHENLEMRKSDRGSYWIPTGNGHVVVVMFGNNSNRFRAVAKTSPL